MEKERKSKYLLTFEDNELRKMWKKIAIDMNVTMKNLFIAVMKNTIDEYSNGKLKQKINKYIGD